MTRFGKVRVAAVLSRLATPRTATVAAWVIAALLGLTFAAGATSGNLTLAGLRTVAGMLVIVLVTAVVGTVVARHQPGNPIGWLLLGVSAWLLLVLASGAYAASAYRHGHHGLAVIAPAAVVLAEQFQMVLIPFPLVILLFPDGHLPSRRWRWPLRAYLVIVTAVPLTIAAISLAILTRGHVRVDADGYLAAVDHPSGSTAFVSPLGAVFAVTVVGFWLAALIRQGLSWRRSSGDRREQLKWLASGAAVCGILGVSAVSIQSAWWEVLIVGFAALPVSIGVAVLKYHLYDIDVVISKTIVYGCLAAFITAVYVLIVAGIGALGTGSLNPGSRPSLGLSILATAVVAVAFQPVRERAQRLANRLVFGRRATPYEALSEFATRMGGAFPMQDVLPRMARVLAQGTGAERAVAWLKSGTEFVPAAWWPADADPPAPGSYCRTSRCAAT